MAFGVDGFGVEAHEVLAVAQVGGVAVHHVAEEAVEVVEAAFVGGIGGFETEVPFADDGGVVAGFFQFGGEGGNVGVEVAPGVFGLGADDAGDADGVGVAAGEEGGTGGRADGAVGAHGGEEHAVAADAIDVGGLDIGGLVGGDVAVAVVVGEDEEEVGGRGREERRAENEEKEGEESFHGLWERGIGQGLAGRAED